MGDKGLSLSSMKNPFPPRWKYQGGYRKQYARLKENNFCLRSKKCIQETKKDYVWHNYKIRIICWDEQIMMKKADKPSLTRKNSNGNAFLQNFDKITWGQLRQVGKQIQRKRMER
jgi:hypothetical protein